MNQYQYISISYEPGLFELYISHAKATWTCLLKCCNCHVTVQVQSLTAQLGSAELAADKLNRELSKRPEAKEFNVRECV